MSQGSVGVNILSNIVGIGGSNVSAFGDIIAVGHTPLVQLDFVFGINSQTGVTTTANSATVDTSSGRLRLQSGTNSAGSAVFQSARIARYRQGQGMMARFTALWSSNAANSTQVVGMGNSQVGYFFGYNGTSFGISLRNGGTDSWTAQSSWNGDTCDGNGASGFNWNKTLGNVMMIRYPFLGYGDITFWVQNPATASWILCHTIRYANSSASLQLSNPSFPFYAQALNSGNTTNLTSYVGSVGVFCSGQKAYLAAQNAITNSKASVTTEVNVLSLRNCTTYNTLTNTGVIRLRGLSVASDGGNGAATIYLKKGVTVGGSPSFTTINGTTADNGVTITSGNSIASYDVAGTTITGGLQLFNNVLARNNSNFIDMTPFDFYILPGETLTISGTCTSSTTIAIAINWNEDV